MKSLLKKLVPAFVKRAIHRRRKEQERLRLAAASGTLRKEDFIRGLREINIQPGDVLFIHSSLSKFGQVEGGPHTVIEALMEAVGPEGTLIFPTFTVVHSMAEMLKGNDYVYDPAMTPSAMGKITETFRNMQGVRRSLHPTHSVAVWGKLQSVLLDGEDLQYPTNFGPGTPMGRLPELNGKIAGLGINMGPVTYYHSFEDHRLHQFPGVYLPHRMKAFIQLADKKVETQILVHDPAYHATRIEKDPRIEAFIRQYFTDAGLRREAQVGPAPIWAIAAADFDAGLSQLLEQGKTIYRI